MRNDLDYGYVPRVKKVKHIMYFCVGRYGKSLDDELNKLAKKINEFADANPNFKILGIRTFFDDYNAAASVTYLEDVEGQFSMEDYDDTDD